MAPHRASHSRSPGYTYLLLLVAQEKLGLPQPPPPPYVTAPRTHLLDLPLLLGDTVGFASYSTAPPPGPHSALTVGKVMLMMLKRLWSLGEMTVRPPPGGPMAAIRYMSWGAETDRGGTGGRGKRQGTGGE